MAQRRMFSKKITETDLFMDMPLSSQALYLHLMMSADDDGFVGNSKTILRMVGASHDDFKLLEAKQFILVFDDGITVIKDWRVHNYIRKDTYQQTIYKKELKRLSIDDNGAYKKDRPRSVDETLTQVRLGKDSIGKFSTGQIKDEEEENKSLTREREFPNPEQIFEDTPQIKQLSLKLLADFMVDSPEQASICIEALSGQYWRLRRLKDEGNSIVVLKEQAYGIDKGILNIIEEAAKYSLEHTKERLNDFNSFGSYFSTGLINKINTAISSGGNNDATV